MESVSGYSKRKRSLGIGSGIVRFGAVSLLVFMLAMSFAPLSPNSVSAAADDDTIVSAQPFVDPAAEDLDAQLTDDEGVPIDPDIEDEALPEDNPTGSVVVDKFGCEQSYGGD